MCNFEIFGNNSSQRKMVICHIFSRHSSSDTMIKSLIGAACVCECISVIDPWLVQGGGEWGS